MIRSRVLPLLALALIAAPFGCGGDSFEQQPDGPRSDGGASDAFDSSTDGPGDAGSDTVVEVADDAPFADAPVDTIEEADAAEEPGDLPLGAPCGPGAICESTHCIDGVCCANACDRCHVCNLPGQEGQCSPAPEGTNPHDDCGASAIPCSGTCDGAGACAYPAIGEPCGPTSCSLGEVEQVVPICDGAGACNDSTIPCAPYRCDAAAGSCFDECTSNEEACVLEAFCDGTACTPKFADGATCGQAHECTSNFCEDGVCCESECDGVCESCAVPLSEGTCAPIPDTTDPDSECLGTDAPCAGMCDGARACLFPGSTQSCGVPVCDGAANTQLESLCDGSGVCAIVPQPCGLFACNDASGLCNASCADDLACVDTAYCKNMACAPKQDNGVVCVQPNECSSGFCEGIPASVQKKCCNSTCPAPLNCSTGECLCSTVTCSAGVACVTWFQDADQDTFGDPLVMLLGCEDAPPTDTSGHPFVRNSDDCYDHNASAKPGQSALFGTHRGDYSFDYNCDGLETKEHDDTLPIGAAQCTDCKSGYNCVACGYMATFWITHGYTCHPSPTCGPRQTRGFKAITGCGQSRTLFECINEANQCTNAENSMPNTIQRCN